LYKHKVTNEDICNKIKPVIEPYKDLKMVNKCKLNGTATFHIHLAYKGCLARYKERRDKEM